MVAEAIKTWAIEGEYLSRKDVMLSIRKHLGMGGGPAGDRRAQGAAALMIDVRDSEQHHPSPEALIRYSEASSFGNFLSHLPLDLKLRARATIRQRLLAITGENGIVQRGKRIVAVAVRK